VSIEKSIRRNITVLEIGGAWAVLGRDGETIARYGTKAEAWAHVDKNTSEAIKRFQASPTFARYLRGIKIAQHGVLPKDNACG
jgi:hypothetical protein